MDIFKMATQIANSMSEDDRSAIEGMDMEKMLSHVTQNVFKMMNGSSDSAAPEGLNGFMDKFNLGNLRNVVVENENVNVIESESCILPKTRDIRFDLNVELSDFYNGKKKKLNIKRKRIIEENGKQKVIEEKKRIVIQIDKGMKDEQQIRFEGEADQIPGYTPGDIIITLIEIENSEFQRDNDNLIIVKNINLYQLYEFSFNITHLDNRILLINKPSSDALHLNDSIRKIKGQGMPIYKKESYGDLFIKFNLVIPKSLEPSKMVSFKQIFDDSIKPIESKFTYLLETINDNDLDDLGSDIFEESDSDSESDLSLSSVSESSVSSVSSDDSPLKRSSKKR